MLKGKTLGNEYKKMDKVCFKKNEGNASVTLK